MNCVSLTVGMFCWMSTMKQTTRWQHILRQLDIIIKHEDFSKNNANVQIRNKGFSVIALSRHCYLCLPLYFILLSFVEDSSILYNNARFSWMFPTAGVEHRALELKLCTLTTIPTRSWRTYIDFYINISKQNIHCITALKSSNSSSILTNSY